MHERSGRGARRGRARDYRTPRKGGRGCTRYVRTTRCDSTGGAWGGQGPRRGVSGHVGTHGVHATGPPGAAKDPRDYRGTIVRARGGNEEHVRRVGCRRRTPLVWYRRKALTTRSTAPCRARRRAQCGVHDSGCKQNHSKYSPAQDRYRTGTVLVSTLYSIPVFYTVLQLTGPGTE